MVKPKRTPSKERKTRSARHTEIDLEGPIAQSVMGDLRAHSTSGVPVESEAIIEEVQNLDLEVIEDAVKMNLTKEDCPDYRAEAFVAETRRRSKRVDVDKSLAKRLEEEMTLGGAVGFSHSSPKKQRTRKREEEESSTQSSPPKIPMQKIEEEDEETSDPEESMIEDEEGEQSSSRDKTTDDLELSGPLDYDFVMEPPEESTEGEGAISVRRYSRFLLEGLKNEGVISEYRIGEDLAIYIKKPDLLPRGPTRSSDQPDSQMSSDICKAIEKCIDSPIIPRTKIITQVDIHKESTPTEAKKRKKGKTDRSEDSQSTSTFSTFEEMIEELDDTIVFSCDYLGKMAFKSDILKKNKKRLYENLQSAGFLDYVINLTDPKKFAYMLFIGTGHFSNVQMYNREWLKDVVEYPRI